MDPKGQKRRAGARRERHQGGPQDWRPQERRPRDRRRCPLAVALRAFWLVAAAALGAGQLAGCAKTTYNAAGHDAAAKPAEDIDLLIGREVTYRVERVIYTAMPRCAVVLAPTGKAPAAIKRLAGPSIARYLRDRIPRVIGPVARRRLQTSHKVDFSHNGDRSHFARATRCDAYLTWRVVTVEDNYFLVWSERRLGLALALYRARDHKLLWRGAHTGRRSDGSLPLSPFSVPFAAYEATSFKGDNDVLPSMVDDVVRRIIVTLPDLR